MRVEDLKRWHWIVIGLGLGLALGYANARPAEHRMPKARQLLPPLEFEQALHAPAVGGNPRIKDIVVYPVSDGLLVRMNLLTSEGGFGGGGGGDKWNYQPAEIFALKPYKPYIPAQGLGRWQHSVNPNTPRKAPAPDYTVISYLRDVAQRNNKVTFRYAWWKEPKYVMAYWTLGMLVMVGGVWPFVLNLLIGAGFGRKKEPEPDYDLDRFKSEEQAKVATVSAADDQELRAHVDQLDHDLEASISGSAPASAEEQAQAPAAIRTLSAGPVTDQTPATPPEDKDYQGDFYPVAKTTKKGRP